MTNEFRFILEPYKGMQTRYHCPFCKKTDKTFTRYIDTETGEHIHPSVGRCNRESNCGYHYTPKQYFQDNKIENGSFRHDTRAGCSDSTTLPKPISFIPNEVLSQTLNPEGYEQNVFIQNLLSRVPFPFETKDVEKVISQYYLGTVCNGYRTGAITFPFIDKCRNVRAVQVKQFDENNHTIGTDFLHSIIGKHHQKKNEALPSWLEAYQNNEIKVSCLFGEHLLDKYTLNPIALVEAPKTAIYSTLYFGFPEQPKNLLWLAVYNLSSLNLNKCKELQGRDVYLFPDLSKDGKAFELWSNKAGELSDLMPGTRFKVSELLETLAPNELRNTGADIADILIKIDWQKFRPKQINQPTPEFKLTPESEKGEKSEPLKQTFILHSGETNNNDKTTKDTENWEQEITELEHYFETTALPFSTMLWKPGQTITDISGFIRSHLAGAKNYNGKRVGLTYLEPLRELKQYLTINLN